MIWINNLIDFYSKKIIPIEIYYKIHNSKLKAIVEVFETWKYYLKGYKHTVLIFINYNNYQCFIVMKNLSSREVC